MSSSFPVTGRRFVRIAARTYQRLRMELDQLGETRLSDDLLVTSGRVMDEATCCSDVRL